jgi:hypothetical protein
MYYIRRKGKIKGPLTIERLQSLRAEDRLRMRDEVAESPYGPWARLSDVYDRVFGGNRSGDDDGVGDEDSFLSALPEESPAREGGGPAGLRAVPVAATDAVSFTLRPWQIAAGAASVATLGVLAILAGVLLSPLVNAPRDDDDKVVAARPPSAPPRPAPPVEAAPPPPVEATVPATVPQSAEATPPPTGKPAPPPVPAVPPPPPALADANLGAKPAPAKPAASPAPAAAAGLANVPLDGDHAAAIKAALAAYYTAAGWEDRYRAVLPGDDVKRTMRSLYDDVDWVAMNWSVATMPPAAELGKAAAAGGRIRVDTTVNGNPHSVLMAYAQGAWRVDWMESFSTLWLTK